MEKFSIPHSLLINLDQTPIKYVPAGRTTLAKKNTKTVPIKGTSDKRTITARFPTLLQRDFLPMQLIYGGKTRKSIAQLKFPEKFSLSYNETHYSNEKEGCKLIEEILQPDTKKVTERENLPGDQKSLVNMDVFKGQVTSMVPNLYKDSNIVVVIVPTSMTNFLQPLDLTVNCFVKKIMREEFNAWYSLQTGNQLYAGKQLQDINVPLRLLPLKPCHAEWLVECYNHMATTAAQNVIQSGWKAAGIKEALQNEVKGLGSLDTFQEIDPFN